MIASAKIELSLIKDHKTLIEEAIICANALNRPIITIFNTFVQNDKDAEYKTTTFVIEPNTNYNDVESLFFYNIKNNIKQS